MNAGSYDDSTLGNEKENEVRKSFKHRSANFSVHQLKRFRVSLNCKNLRFDIAQKIHSQTFALILVPVKRFIDIELRLRTNYQFIVRRERVNLSLRTLQVTPSSGLSSYACVRRSNSVRISSVSGNFSFSAAMLSQISSTIWIRSATLSSKMPATCVFISKPPTSKIIKQTANTIKTYIFTIHPPPTTSSPL